jgi:hypothetical protein
MASAVARALKIGSIDRLCAKLHPARGESFQFESIDGIVGKIRQRQTVLQGAAPELLPCIN